MSEELIQEVHEEVNLETADAEYHMLLGLSPVAAVVPARFLPLHPQKGQLLELQAGRHQSHSTDGKWIKLGWLGYRENSCWMRKMIRPHEVFLLN